MSNLTINERIKDIAIPGQNENFYSNIKKFFGEIIKFEPKILNQLEIIKKGVFLEEENFDFIGNTQNKEDVELLDEKGYEETSADNFHLEPYNATNVTKVNEVKNHKLFNKTIKFLSNTKEELLIFEKQENNIFVFKNNKKNLFLEIKCINGELIDFGFCNNNFLYILYEYENQLCLLKTHKTYSFFIEHDEEISTLDLLNCEYFFNIKNITYEGEVTYKKYTKYNISTGEYGSINDDQLRGKWKRYKISELINTKIISNINSKKTTSSFTLLKELSDKIKKFPFRIIANFEYNDFTTNSFNIQIDAGNGVIDHWQHKSYDSGKNAVILFDNLSNFNVDANVTITNNIGIEIFFAIDFYEYEDNEYEKSYAENYFNYKIYYINGFVNNLLFLKPGYKVNVWVDCKREYMGQKPTKQDFYFGKQIIIDKRITEKNKVQKLSFNKYGSNNMDYYEFYEGEYNYWFCYKIQYINEATNEETFEYVFQSVKLADTTEEFIDIKNSKLFSDSKNNIFLLNGTNKYKVNPIKKYYCFKDGLYFYNKTKDVEGDFNGIKNFKQIEHLFLYELVKMFGLENFKTTNIRSVTNNLSNISSENNTEIKNLFKFKFDNTFNGLINFFNFSETKSNFYVNIDNGKIICKGNIYNETINKSQNKHDNNRDNKRGDYKITIKILEKVFGKEDIIKCMVRLHKKTNEGIYEIIDSKELFSSKSFDELTRSLFYSNLEFYFYNFEYQKDEEFEILFKYNYDPEIKFIEAETFVENKIIPGIQDIKYKVHNPKGIVINNKQKHDNLDFKIEGNHLLFKNIELNNDKKLNSKLKKENFKIPLIINGKATNTFKTLNKSKNFYVEYEDLVEFNSADIAKQIEDEKEIILILED